MTTAKRFSAKGFSAWVDGAADSAGPRPGPAARIVAENGGFALQECKILVDRLGLGRWSYERVAWSRDRKDMVESARLRQLPLS